MRSGPRQVEAQSVNLVNDRTRLLCCAVCMYICMYVYRTVRAGRGKVQYSTSNISGPERAQLHSTEGADGTELDIRHWE